LASDSQAERKNRERAILEMVYDVDRFDSVRDSESPDFVLQHHNQNECFGVEVTEFYLTGSDARIRNISGYMPSLFAGGPARHREDVDALKVRKATLTRADGSGDEIIDVISRKLPEVSTYVRMVTDVIERKDQKVAIYEHKLSHVNLVILDHGNRLITVSPEQFYPLFYTADLRKTLAQTGFRVVFFVTTLERTRRVYVPLKTLFLVSEFYMFYWAQDEYQEDRKFESIRTELELFVEFMLQQGVSIAFSERADEGIELLWANCSILVNDSGIIIRDHADYALPQGIGSSDKCSRDSLLDPPFLAFLEDFKKRNTFVTDMSVDVIKDSQT